MFLDPREVQEDGGDLQLKSWNPETGEVILRLQGACRGCPQSAVTLQDAKRKIHFIEGDGSMICFCFVLYKCFFFFF